LKSLRGLLKIFCHEYLHSCEDHKFLTSAVSSSGLTICADAFLKELSHFSNFEEAAMKHNCKEEKVLNEELYLLLAFFLYVVYRASVQSS